MAGEGDAHRPPASETSLRAIFAGRRGRLLIALLVAEFGGAVQSTAYSSVLPVVSHDLGGAQLYGATLVAGTFTMILILAVGPRPFAQFGPAQSLLLATAGFVVGVGLTVGAVSMVMVLAGTIIRGLAGGLLAGFGLTALGALYDDDLRPRVVGLFAVMWLLPSLVGPALNSVLTLGFGWRTAMGWPAVLVLLGRFLIGRHVAMIPWERSTSRSLSLLPALTLLAGLIVAAVAPAPHNRAGIVMLVVGVAVATASTVHILRNQVGSDRRRLLTMGVMFALCMAFFGGNGLISLAAISGLGHGIVGGSAAVGAGLLGWAVTGMRPVGVDSRIGDPQVLGLIMLIAALGLISASLLALTGTRAFALLVGAWAFGGIGMGLAYNRVFSESVDRLPPERTYVGAVAVEFAETSGNAIGTLLSGGTYSLATALGIPSHRSTGVAFAVLAVAAVCGVVVRIRRQRRRAPIHS